MRTPSLARAVALILALSLVAAREHFVPQLNDACAAIASHQVWEEIAKKNEKSPPKETGRHMWDYKIQVHPWRVFETLTWTFSPANVDLDAVYAANVLSNTEGAGNTRTITFELGPKPQDGDTFSVAGSSMESAPHDSKFGCKKTEQAAIDCPMLPGYRVLNNFGGVVSSRVGMEAWQPGAVVHLTFDTQIVISSVWGADLGDGFSPNEPTRTASFTLRTLPNGLSPERADAFGFDGMPPFHDLPKISCDLAHELPPPPPPNPPPPAPPPPYEAEFLGKDCFLGGRLRLITAPPTATPTATLILARTWDFELTLDRWQAGVTLTLELAPSRNPDDPAADGVARPLQVDVASLPDALHLADGTAHSATFRLVGGVNPGKMRATARGDVAGLRTALCCCAVPPPPPPLPPPAPQPPPATPWPPSVPVLRLDHDLSRGAAMPLSPEEQRAQQAAKAAAAATAEAARARAAGGEGGLVGWLRRTAASLAAAMLRALASRVVGTCTEQASWTDAPPQVVCTGAVVSTTLASVVGCALLCKLCGRMRRRRRLRRLKRRAMAGGGKHIRLSTTDDDDHVDGLQGMLQGGDVGGDQALDEGALSCWCCWCHLGGGRPRVAAAAERETQLAASAAGSTWTDLPPRDELPLGYDEMVVGSTKFAMPSRKLAGVGGWGMETGDGEDAEVQEWSGGSGADEDEEWAAAAPPSLEQQRSFRHARERARDDAFDVFADSTAERPFSSHRGQDETRTEQRARKQSSPPASLLAAGPWNPPQPRKLRAMSEVGVSTAGAAAQAAVLQQLNSCPLRFGAKPGGAPADGGGPSRGVAGWSPSLPHPYEAEDQGAVLGSEDGDSPPDSPVGTLPGFGSFGMGDRCTPRGGDAGSVFGGKGGRAQSEVGVSTAGAAQYARGYGYAGGGHRCNAHPCVRQAPQPLPPPPGPLQPLFPPPSSARRDVTREALSRPPRLSSRGSTSRDSQPRRHRSTSPDARRRGRNNPSPEALPSKGGDRRRGTSSSSSLRAPVPRSKRHSGRDGSSGPTTERRSRRQGQQVAQTTSVRAPTDDGLWDDIGSVVSGQASMRAQTFRSLNATQIID